MIVDRTLLEEYPYYGEFYRVYYDDSGDLKDQGDKEELVLATECDILESARSTAHGFSSATFAIYFPIDKSKKINLKRGHSFRGSIYGMEVKGEVTGVFPSQLGGCVAYIKEVSS